MIKVAFHDMEARRFGASFFFLSFSVTPFQKHKCCGMAHVYKLLPYIVESLSITFQTSGSIAAFFTELDRRVTTAVSSLLHVRVRCDLRRRSFEHPDRAAVPRGHSRWSSQRFFSCFARVKPGVSRKARADSFTSTVKKKPSVRACVFLPCDKMLPLLSVA